MNQDFDAPDEIRFPMENLELAVHPFIFQASSRQCLRMLEHLRNQPQVRIKDTIQAQLQDLIRSRHPKARLDLPSMQQAVAEHLNGQLLSTYGVWVYFPWNRYLVHLLDRDEFAELRSNRNRNKITESERQRLGRVSVGLVGLSVGNAIAITMTMEGTYGHLALADFDHLELSNLNRIHVGVHELGENKAITTARQIYEMNPFAQLSIFEQGLSSDNLEEFFQSGGGLDCLIDECDDIAIKFLLREHARRRRIPVLMSTSDRGMFDIERFDLEPERSVFHGAFGQQIPSLPSTMSSQDKIRYVLPILGLDGVSPRGAASMLEVGESLSTWPQLAEDVMLGGAMAASSVRRLFLDQRMESGRYYLDLDEFGENRLPIDDSPNSDIGKVPKNLSSDDAKTIDQLQEIDSWMKPLLEAACMAPSGGNCQPWAFSARDGKLHFHLDLARGKSPQDPGRNAAYLAVGAAVWNAKLAAYKHSFPVEFTTELHPIHSPDQRFHHVARASFNPDCPPQADMETDSFQDWCEQIGIRSTDRQRKDFVPLPSDIRSSVAQSARLNDCVLEWLESDEDKRRIAAAIGITDRIRLLCPQLHRSMMSELRWTSQESSNSGDGIDVASLQLSPLEESMLRCLKRPEVVRELREQRLGRRLATLCHQPIMQSSAVGLLSHRDDSCAGWLHCGEVMQRLWLQCTSKGWNWYPMTAILFLVRNYRDGLQGLFTEEEIREFDQASSELDDLFPESRSLIRSFLFCVRPASDKIVRSKRRKWKDCLISH